MIRRIFSTLRTATLSDWMAAMIFAAAFVGMVEAPWIALAMPVGPRSHASHEAPSGLRHPVSIAIAKEN